MSLTLHNTGSNSINIPIWGINEEYSIKSVIIPCSGNKDVVQMFGRNNRVYDITGIAKTSDIEIFISNLIGYTGSMLFSTGIIKNLDGDFDPIDFNSTDFRTSGYTENLGLIETDISHTYTFGPNNFMAINYNSLSIPMPVYFENLEWHDNSQRPFEKHFTIKVRELIYTTRFMGGSIVPSVGIYDYDINSTISVLAIPDNNYNFINWIVDDIDVGNTNPYDITMDADHIIQAVFQSS